MSDDALRLSGPASMRICRRCRRRFRPRTRRERSCSRCAGRCPCCGHRIGWVKADRDLARELEATA